MSPSRIQQAVRHGMLALLLAAALAPAADAPVKPTPASDPASASTSPPSPFDGVWRWDFHMPDGTTIRPRLNLTVEGSRATGTTSFRPGTETAITNGVVSGNTVRFDVVRPRDGQPVHTHYQATLEGPVLRGRIESDWAGRTEGFDWEARRAHSGVEGTWRWTNSVSGTGRGAGRVFETRVELEQDGHHVTGKVLSRFARSTPVQNGSITNGEVYFEIERTFGDNRTLTRLRGKQTGDTIRGTLEVETDDDTLEGPWEARRSD